MNRRKILLIIFVFVSVFFVSLFFKKELIKHKWIGKETIILFEKDTLNLARLKHRKEVELYLVYKNIGNNGLEINNVLVDCQCTTGYEYSKNKLEPGKKDSIKMILNTSKLGFFVTRS